MFKEYVLIQLTNLTKRFKEKTAVDNVSFTANSGEIFGLLGSNGAGKTTTLRMLATMLTPSDGTAQLDGFDIIKQPEKVRSCMGLLFGGDMGLYDRLTAKENIVYFAQLSDMTTADAEKQAEELARLFDFSEYLNMAAKKLSKGTRQKVALARSVAHNPSCMLFDEPMVGLDVTARREVEEFIFSLKKQNKTIMLSDHNLEIIERLCDRVAILQNGKVMALDTIPELCKKYECEKLEDVFFKLQKEGK